MKKALALVALTAILAQAAAAQDSGGLWGTGPNDVWALRSFGAAHFDGRAWSYQQFGAFAVGRDMHGSAANNIWALGRAPIDDRTLIHHFNGTSWDTVPPPATTRRLERIAVSATNVFVLETGEESDTLAVHVWNGRSWRRERLPFSFVVAGMKLVGSELWIAGYAYFDPRPDTRNQHGVLLRRVAGRWVSNWNGRSSTDPVIGAASWISLDALGDRVVLLGEESSGAKRLLMRRGAAAWQRVDPPASLPDGAYVSHALLLGNGSLVVRYQGRSRAGFLRYSGTAWEPFASMLTPAVFPDRPRMILGLSNWSPPGADYSYTLVDPFMVGRLTATETAVQAAMWCLGPDGAAASGAPFGGAGAAICTAIAAGASVTPAAAPAGPSAAPATPGAKSGKRRAPPSGLPSPSRP